MIYGPGKPAKVLRFVAIGFFLLLFVTCKKRQEAITGHVYSRHGYGMPNTYVNFGYSIGKKTTIRVTRNAITDGNGRYFMEKEVPNKAKLRQIFVSSDSGYASVDIDIPVTEMDLKLE